MKIVLAGNPNAGKTTLFNALTKSKLKTGNWHGVTTRPASKTYGGVTYVDVPGMYSFNPYSMEEDCAAKEIKSADVVINVADGLTLKNSLALTRTIVSMNKRTVIYVTKLRQLKRRGGRLDAAELSRLLGVPVVCDIKELKRILKDPSAIQKASPASSNSKSRLDAAYYGGNCTLTRAEKLFYNRYFALAFFIVAVLFMFFTAFFPGMPGDALKGLTEELISVKLGGAVKSVLPEGKVRSLVCDGIIGGAGGVLSFIPQLTVLFLFLTLLDESGVMSALSFVTDGVFQKVKLSGRAAFSVLMGFGCSAAAILTTRGLENKRLQKRAILILPYVSCSAKMPVYLAVVSAFFEHKFLALAAIYFTGLLFVFAAAFVCITLAASRER